MNERPGAYDILTWSRYFKDRRSAKKAEETAKTAEIAKTIESIEAGGDSISPYGPLISKLVNPRIR